MENKFPELRTIQIKQTKKLISFLLLTAQTLNILNDEYLQTTKLIDV